MPEENINGFIQQTANDYAMSYEDVELIYNQYQGNEFYEKLEEFIIIYPERKLNN